MSPKPERPTCSRSANRPTESKSQSQSSQRGRRERKLPLRSEHSEQADVVQRAFLHRNLYPELRWLHSVPNGATLPAVYVQGRDGKIYRKSRAYETLREEGLNPGVPDLHLPVPRRGFHAMWIEMKRADGRVEPHQEAWRQYLVEANYHHVIARSAEEAWRDIVWYLSGPPTRVLRE